MASDVMTARSRDRDDLTVVYKNEGDKGLIDWNPYARRKLILDYILRVLREQAAYLPLGPRRIAYILKADGRCVIFEVDQLTHEVTERRITKKDFQKIGEVIAKARRAGYIPWEAISDGSQAVSAPFEFADEAALIQTLHNTAKSARLTRQSGQRQVLEIHVEAKESISQIDALAHEYGIWVRSGSGSNGISVPKELADRAIQRWLAGMKGGLGTVVTVVLHIGDHDPKGIEIFNTLRTDAMTHIRTWLVRRRDWDEEEAQEQSETILRVERVAPLPSQIADRPTRSRPRVCPRSR